MKQIWTSAGRTTPCALMGLLASMAQETPSHASVSLGMKEHLALMILMSVNQIHVLMLEFARMGLASITVHVRKVSLDCFLFMCIHLILGLFWWVWRQLTCPYAMHSNKTVIESHRPILRYEQLKLA